MNSLIHQRKAAGAVPAAPQAALCAPWKGLGLLLTALLFGSAFAGGALQAQGSIQLQINVEEGGEELRIDTVIQWSAEDLDGDGLEALLKRLREMDIDADLDLDGMSEGEDVEIIINRTQRGDGESFRLELNELVPDLSGLFEDLQELQQRVRVYRSELEDSAPRAFLGVYFDVEELVEGHAARVTGVIPETGAAAAGLQEDDVILGMDGNAFDGAYGIREALAGYAPGDEVTLQVRRDGRTMDVPATLGEPMEKQELHWIGDDGRFEFEWDGDVDLHDMEMFLDKQASIAGVNKPFLGVYLDEETDRGVRISGTVSGTTAEALGLMEGDVVTAINGIPTGSTSALKEAIGTLQVGSPLSVDYLREGERGVATGTMQAKHHGAERLRFNEGLQNALRDMEQMIEEEVILEGEHLSEDLLQDLQRLREMEDMEILFGGEDLDNDNTRVVRRVAVFITMDVPSASDMDQLRANANPPLAEGTDLELDMVRFQPNPNNGQFELSFDLNEDGPVMVRLFDGAGRQVFDSDFTAQAGTNTLKVDALGEPKGVYYLVIEQGNQAYTRKVIIQ